jgi:hypothetical protein
MFSGFHCSYENVDKVLANSPPPPAARSPTTASASASASPSAEHAGADQMDDFEDDQRHTKKADSKNTKVQKILANQDAVNAMEVAGRDVEIADGAQKANYLAEQFEKEARMTEKLHLFWVNKKMEKMKSGAKRAYQARRMLVFPLNNLECRGNAVVNLWIQPDCPFC